MTGHDEHDVEAVFLEALGRDASDRERWLLERCGGNDRLHRRVSELLAHHDAAGSFLEKPALRRDAGAAVPGRPPLRRIPGFEILELLGRGGMGIVYRARQEQPNRIVALKVVQRGLVSDRLIRRFEHEIELIGRLEHPGIARVYEAGTFDAGDGPEPYFAMELVEGLPLTEYARRHGLSNRKRLRLLAEVADAVQHAHERAVIHRDLKPANILVDASGKPRILDFGIARATDSDRQLATVHTEAGEILGTLAYMAPEQLTANVELDTRADIYALGVIGYELMAGRLPHDLSGRPLVEAVETLSKDTAPPLGTLNRTLKGDVEVMIAKAMERNRERRYNSAAELAADIRRYLADEPIVARPPTAAYQLRKLVARHRVFVLSAAALFVTVTGFAVWMTILYAESNRLRLKAEEERKSAEAVTTFLNEMLESSNPNDATGPEATVRQILDNSASRLEETFAREPAVAARLHRTVGNSYRALGRLAEADSHLARALSIQEGLTGRADLEFARTMDDVASLREAQGHLDESEKLHQENLRLRQRLDPEGESVAETMNNLGNLYVHSGNYAAADSLFAAALPIVERVSGSNGAHYSEILNNWSLSRLERMEFAAAESLLVQVVAIDRKLWGPHHANVGNSLNNLGLVLHRQGRRKEAEPLYRESLSIARRVYGDRGTFLSMALSNLGALLREENELAEAEPLIREAVEVERRTGGDATNWKVGTILNNLGEVVEARGDLAAADSILTAAERNILANLGPDHRRTGTVRANRGRVLFKLGRYDESESELREGCRILEASLGPANDRTVRCRKNLIELYERTGRTEAATEVRRSLPDSLFSAPRSGP